MPVIYWCWDHMLWSEIDICVNEMSWGQVGLMQWNDPKCLADFATQILLQLFYPHHRNFRIYAIIKKRINFFCSN